jgi:hypothetical protein
MYFFVDYMYTNIFIAVCYFLAITIIIGLSIFFTRESSVAQCLYLLLWKKHKTQTRPTSITDIVARVIYMSLGQDSARSCLPVNMRLFIHPHEHKTLLSCFKYKVFWQYTKQTCIFMSYALHNGYTLTLPCFQCLYVICQKLIFLCLEVTCIMTVYRIVKFILTPLQILVSIISILIHHPKHVLFWITIIAGIKYLPRPCIEIYCTLCLLWMTLVWKAFSRFK